MAPPQKRRKLTDSSSLPVYQTVQPFPEPSKCLAHQVENVEHSFTTAILAPPQRIEKVHLQIQRRAVVQDPDLRGILPRQAGTAVSSSSVASSSTTSASSSNASNTPATTSAGASPTASLNALSILESSLVDSSSSDPGSTSTNSSTSSDTSSSSAELSSSTDSGFIGMSPTSASASITPSTAVDNSTASATSTFSGASSAIVSSSANLTISATTITESSTTITSSIALNTSSTDVQTSTATTSSQTGSETIPPFVYIATLSNGDVEYITRSSKAYVTTFPDGEKSTIAPFSGSVRVSTEPDGKTSTFLETTMISPTTTAGQSTITSAVTVDGGQGAGAGVGAGTVVVSSTSTSSSHHMAGSGSGGASSTPPAGTIAGGVVGGAAGLAVILLAALVLLRWYKSRAQQGHQALPPSSTMSPEPDQSRGPGMAERAGLMPLVSAVPSLFRHHDRSPVEASSSERGFTRVSGRKLPSAFSEGMTGPPPNMPLTGPERNLSSTSFYRDSTGFYGGDGESATSGEALGAAGHGGGRHNAYEEMTLSPGPQRRPTVHAGGPYVISPHGSHAHTPIIRSDTPGSPTLGTLGRSDTPSSADGNRSSRFTEEV